MNDNILMKEKVYGLKQEVRKKILKTHEKIILEYFLSFINNFNIL